MDYLMEVTAAREAALRGGKAALELQRRGVTPERKSDASPVTIADKEAERIIAEVLIAAFPEDGLLGEEGVDKASVNGRRWIIDPIDGTRDFVRGSRVWSVHVALEQGGEVVAGVSHLPGLSETFWAAKGQGAYHGDRRIHVSQPRLGDDLMLCVNGIQRMRPFTFFGEWLEWLEDFAAIRSSGGSYDAMNVAAGRADAWIVHGGKSWDFAPVKIITEEAGGVFRNFDGGASIYAGNAFTCAPALESKLAGFLVRP